MNRLLANGTIWPIGIVVFFLVLFSVNGSFLYLSVTNRPALVTDNPYRDGLVFQETIDARNVAREDFNHEVSGSCAQRQCKIDILLTPKAETTMPAQISLSIQKVGTAEEILQLKPNAVEEIGRYSFSHPKIQKGLWLIEGTFQHKGQKGLFREKVLLR